MAKHTDCFLYLRIKGKTLDNLQDLLSTPENAFSVTDKSALSIILERAIDYWVYEAVKGKLMEKYGDVATEHRDPDWKSLKQKQMNARAEKEAVKKAQREGDYE